MRSLQETPIEIQLLMTEQLGQRRDRLNLMYSSRHFYNVVRSLI